MKYRYGIGSKNTVWGQPWYICTQYCVSPSQLWCYFYRAWKRGLQYLNNPGLYICIRNHQGALNPVNAVKRDCIFLKWDLMTAMLSVGTLTVMAPYTIIALMVSISREMANPTQAFSARQWGGDSGAGGGDLLLFIRHHLGAAVKAAMCSSLRGSWNCVSTSLLTQLETARVEASRGTRRRSSRKLQWNLAQCDEKRSALHILFSARRPACLPAPPDTHAPAGRSMLMRTVLQRRSSRDSLCSSLRTYYSLAAGARPVHDDITTARGLFQAQLWSLKMMWSALGCEHKEGPCHSETLQTSLFGCCAHACVMCLPA